MKKILPVLLVLLLTCFPSCMRDEAETEPASDGTVTTAEQTNPPVVIESAPDTQPSETEPADTEPEEITIVLGEDPAETKRDEPDTTESIETDPPETEPESAETEPIETEPPQTEPDVTEAEPVEMIIPASYAEINRALREGEWFGMTYEEAIERGITETEMAETEAPLAVPQTGFADDIAMQPGEPDTGKVYKADDLFSKTNTQLADVDEGDIVKTDGEYIYVLKNQKDADELVILSADGEDTKVLSTTTLTEDIAVCGVAPEGSPDSNTNIEITQMARDLYISGDFLAVITMEFNRSNGRRTNYNTYVDIYNISDPAAPGYITTLGQSGAYITSRMIGDTVWLITRQGIAIGDIEDPDNPDRYIPSLFGPVTKENIPVSSMVYPEEIPANVYTVISSYDISSGGRGASKAILGTLGTTVYVSGGQIYLADRESYETESEPYQADAYTAVDITTGQRTRIISLALGEEIRTSAMVTVPGSLLNQFSMDEADGYLRVVTTLREETRTHLEHPSLGITNNLWKSSISRNALYILDENLKITGKIEDVAPDETVKSVRFMGDTGYFVTFRLIDPLFAVDLSNPDAPVIMSELKLPGFSSYLHPYDDGLLFGLGKDADPETGSIRGVKLSMFDTSDPYDITEEYKLTLNYDWSSALNNHKAILVSASRSLIGFPAERGYAVFGFDAEKGFTEIAFIAMKDTNWNGSSRGLYVGDALYIVMQKSCTVLDLQNFRILNQTAY